ncbi:retron St85 family RNA-directed DNA polymerase [Roseococcus sp. SDR]|uniref:retron St85 family RNA-directed DNA polymerase n=1 Tax=Roseococcus sp. SDR TaxID=2835532 RepID=UPI001BCD29B2|nr:retron St85 family RNA-directed DNA polymerase [Roseococcus sp. SDR]MBS7790660.1 retron St85 family RNA-directed DNA polymerase [Roseococcus sp. SDR]MBV1845974.1 retron St85 family RNA-directed DNA polymerase [Roseococcus sp. SDR]
MLTQYLAQATGLSTLEIERIARSAPRRYKDYMIPKANGGHRLISHPAREVKALQRALVEWLSDKFPVHHCATAYKKGGSIALNADQHAQNGPIMKMDFRNFFPSIKSHDWIKFITENNFPLNEFDRELTRTILFHKRPSMPDLRLAIGAPSSPFISNIMMYDFDCYVHDKTKAEKITYTRYADDLTFSSARAWNLRDVEPIIKKAVRDHAFSKLEINNEKTRVVTTKFRRIVTGVTLANQGHISVGRNAKRELRAIMSRLSLRQTPKQNPSQIVGILGFLGSIEPKYLQSLKEKYGKDTFDFLYSLAGDLRTDNRQGQADAATED